MFTLGKHNNFYKSTEWKSFVKNLKLSRLNSSDGVLYCEHCGKPILKKYDCIAHHVIELTEDNVNDLDISLNEDNVKLIHFRCHNQIHNRFGFNKKNVYIVYGPPCSGKKTFVNNNATKDDIVVDIDSIYKAITINNMYDKDTRVKSNVFQVKDFLIDMIKDKNGKWNNAYIIGGYASRGERERLEKTLNAKSIYIDTDIETCIERAEAERPIEYIDYINDWFDDYQT